MTFDVISLEQALEALGQLLVERDCKYEIVVIGGGGLLLLGHILRPTKDLDVVALMENHLLITARPLPSPLVEAIGDIAKAFKLNEKWINSGPCSQLDAGLPDGFKERLHVIQYGNLVVYLASRLDQIHLKLFAATDEGPSSKHFSDLKSLYPDLVEVDMAQKWCLQQDVSEEFLSNLKQAVEHLR